MLRKTILVFLFTICGLNTYGRSQADYLLLLDQYLEKHDYYTLVKEARIDSLISIAENTTLTDREQFQLNKKIYEEYYAYRYDLAKQYVIKNRDIAQRLNCKKSMVETKIQFACLNGSAGMYFEAIENLRHIDRSLLDSTLLIYYYSAQEWLCYAMKEYSSDPFYSPEYEKMEYAYRDSIFHLLEPGTLKHQHYQAKIYMQEGLLEKSLNIYLPLLESLPTEDPNYAFIAFDIASIYQRYGDVHNQQRFLVKSAISDIIKSQKENYALQQLAESIYKSNPDLLDKAFIYMKQAMADARFFNSRLRMVQISETLPNIVYAYKKQRDQGYRNLAWGMTGMTFLFIVVLCLVWAMLKQISKVRSIKNELESVNDKLTLLNHELKFSNKTKEQYIGLFSDLCASYIHKLDDFRVIVKRKIISKQIDKLYSHVNSTFSIQEELKEFFTIFDNAFLNIFPTFVEDFNDLLLPEERIVLKEGEKLNRELRIYALIRLGITDSSKIADFLHYSPQTIYNNRSKVKNKAINRDTFENLVMNIGEIH